MKENYYRGVSKVSAAKKTRHFIFRKFTGVAASFMVLVLLSGCAEIMDKVTKIDQIHYKPVCQKAWKGKTVFIDFDTNRSWHYNYASNLSSEIRDKLIEDIVEDGCFHVQDRPTGRRYAYKIAVRIADPVIQGQNRTIQHVSAAFRVKIYNSRDNLITAKTRKVTYDAPPFVLNVNNSQDELLENYAYNASIKIREMLYEGLK